MKLQKSNGTAKTLKRNLSTINENSKGEKVYSNYEKAGGQALSDKEETYHGPGSQNQLSEILEEGSVAKRINSTNKLSAAAEKSQIGSRG